MTKHMKISDDTRIQLQRLYNISLETEELHHPTFSTDPKFLLSTGSIKIKDDDYEENSHGDPSHSYELTSPTMWNLAWHFEYFKWYSDAMLNRFYRSKKREQNETTDERLFAAAKAQSLRTFEQQLVIPLRRALFEHQFPLYFYCVPKVTFEVNPLNGEIEEIRGEQVLRILPKTVDVGRHFGLTDQELKLLAPDILALIQNLCGRAIVRSPQQLHEAFDQWAELVSPDLFYALAAPIYEEQPHLFTTEIVERHLLPIAALNK